MNILALAAVAALQAPQPVAAPPPASSPVPVAQSIAPTVRIAHDTPVELMAIKEVSTASAKPGTVFELRVNRAIEIDGRKIIPVGTLAYGMVINAVESGGLGKSGQMTAKLLEMRLGNVEIPLDGEMSEKGTGAGSAAVAVLFTGVVGLFHRGNNAKIKACEIITGYVAKDVTLDLPEAPQKPMSQPVPQTPAVMPVASTTVAPETPITAAIRQQ